MIDNPTLTISLGAAASASPTDLALLEQEPWGAYAGRVTKLGMARYLAHALYAAGTSVAAAAPQVVDCGRDGAGNLDTAVLVWPLREDVRYRLFVTVGRLGAGELAEVVESDVASFTLTQAASLEHPARRVLTAEWLTGPWTTGGVKIAPPPLMVEGRELRTNIPTYGSVRVRYAARRYRHALSISWDEAKALLAADNWSEWAVCLPDSGRPVALALSADRGARAMAESDKSCGRSRFRVEQPEAEWPPYCPPEDKSMRCEYCTGACEDA